MVTNYPHGVTAAQTVPADFAERASDSLLQRALRWLAQTYCGLFGHDPVLQFENDRMYLRCTSCGHDSPGWEIGKRRPRLRFRGDRRRHALQPVRALPARKTA